jgi:hypothetical protein
MRQEGEDGQLVHDGLTEQQLLMLAEIEAEEEEKHAVAEFKRRLDFNMGRVRVQSLTARPSLCMMWCLPQARQHGLWPRCC